MDIEIRFAEIAKDAADYGGRIMFGPKLEALLRYWYTTGIADAGGFIWDGKELRRITLAEKP